MDRTMNVPNRSGTLPPDVARALYTAATAAENRASYKRPLLEQVCLEGHEDCIRAVATDAYHLLTVDAPRTRAGIKPPDGKCWAFDANGLRKSLPTKAARLEPELQVERISADVAVLVDGAGQRQAWQRLEMTRLDGGLKRMSTSIYPEYEKPTIRPEGPPAWAFMAELRALVSAVRAIHRVYGARRQDTPVILSPEDGGLGIYPSSDLRSRASWPPPIAGQLVPGPIEFSRDVQVTANLIYLTDALPAILEYEGNDATAILRVYGALSPIQIVTARCGYTICPMENLRWAMAPATQCEMEMASATEEDEAT